MYSHIVLTSELFSADSTFIFFQRTTKISNMSLQIIFVSVTASTLIWTIESVRKCRMSCCWIRSEFERIKFWKEKNRVFQNMIIAFEKEKKVTKISHVMNSIRNTQTIHEVCKLLTSFLMRLRRKYLQSQFCEHIFLLLQIKTE